MRAVHSSVRWSAWSWTGNDQARVVHGDRFWYFKGQRPALLLTIGLFCRRCGNSRARATDAPRISTQLCLTCLPSRHKSGTRSRIYSIELDMCAAALDVNSEGDRTAHGLLRTAVGAHAKSHTRDIASGSQFASSASLRTALGTWGPTRQSLQLACAKCERIAA